jgi:sulfur carrier protein
MEITVNGQPHQVPEGTTVAQLIRLLELHRSACAAEVNAQLVPRRDHDSAQLASGDRVELVTLVGGG